METLPTYEGNDVEESLGLEGIWGQGHMQCVLFLYIRSRLGFVQIRNWQATPPLCTSALSDPPTTHVAWTGRLLAPFLLHIFH